MGIEVRKTYRTANIIGLPVKNPAGEHLGQVEELVVDLETGRIAYLVLSFGGILGMGGKLFAVPWEAAKLKYEEVGKSFIVGVDREVLKNAPGFDKDYWPDMADPDWASTLETHYGRSQQHEQDPFETTVDRPAAH